jgi:Cys-tRNA(Pro)/Cys-tRNA(Cys) deacylase
MDLSFRNTGERKTMAKQRKTNAIRIVRAAGVACTISTYDTGDGRTCAAAVAEKLNKDPAELFKTLVCRGGKNIYVFCVPSNEELDLKKAARAAGEKKIELAALKELFPLSGYVRGGCSPIGMKKAYPLFVDSRAERMPLITVSGGEPGIQLSLAPGDLLRITGASTACLCAGRDTLPGNGS